MGGSMYAQCASTCTADMAMFDKKKHRVGVEVKLGIRAGNYGVWESLISYESGQSA